MYINQHGRPPKYLKVMGDDSIAADSIPISLDDAAELFAQVGILLNVQKSAVLRNINNLTFLGFKINFGMPLKSFEEWIALLALPKGFDKTWDDVATRALGLFFANQGVDEKFNFLCLEIINLKPFYDSIFL